MSDKTRLLGGRYEVGELVGRGGMAEVHKGFDTRLGRQVAVKMLRHDLARDSSFLTRFRREAQSSAGLNHSAIVAVYDSGEERGTAANGQTYDIPYIVMEYVEGQTLRQVLTERGKFSPKEAARVTEGVLDALAYSHRMGIVHRDIKPANVMIGQDGSVKVMDFGIARAIADSNATMTQTQAVIGTAQYLSPEQAQGQQVDARSDLYSTGCMLYELMAGRPPFQGDSPVAIAYQHVGQAPQPPSTYAPSIPPALDQVVLHALTKDRDARYQAAGDFRADLQNVRIGRPISDAASGSAAAGADSGAAGAGLAAGAGVGAAGAAGAAAGGATQVIDPLASEPTEVYSPTPRPTGPPQQAIEDTNTSSFPPVGQQPKRSGNGAAYALLAVAMLVALALIGFGVKTYVDGQNAAPVNVTVPKVIGLPKATAEQEITRAGLQPRVETEQSSDVAVDAVIRQDPQSRVTANRGATVTIWISTGPAPVSLPDLKGRTQQEAEQLLSDLGLKVGTVDQVDDSGVDKGKVAASEPASGTQVAAGSSVTLKVSSGKVTVPQVVGKQQNEAADLINQADLRIKTTYEQTSDTPEGQVISQQQDAGSKVDSGTVINIVVAQAKPASPTPEPTTSSPTPSETPTPSESPSPSETPSSSPSPSAS